MPNHTGPIVRPVRAWMVASSCVLCFSMAVSAQSTPATNVWPAAPEQGGQGTSAVEQNPSGARPAFSQGFRPLAPVSEYYPVEGQTADSPPAGTTPPSPHGNTAQLPDQRPDRNMPAGSAVTAPATEASKRSASAGVAQENGAARKDASSPTNSRPGGGSENATAASLPLTRPGSAEADGKPTKRVGSTSSQLGMTVVALAAVLLLIVVLAKVLKKHTPLAGKTLPEEALDLLGRKMIDQRNAVQFLRIGDRILVVGVSVDGLRTLAEITDPVEVDRIAGACRVPAAETAMGKSFRFLLSRQDSETAATEKPAASPRSSRRKRFSLPSAPAGFSWETPDVGEDSGISQNDIAELTRTLQEAREGKA